MKVDLPMLGVLFLLACVVVGRMLLVKARRRIPAAKQRELYQSFAKIRIYAMMPTAILLVAFIAFMHFTAMTRGDLVGFMAVLALIAIVTQVMIYKKFAAFDFPKDYLRSQTISAALTLIGVLVYIATVAYTGI